VRHRQGAKVRGTVGIVEEHEGGKALDETAALCLDGEELHGLSAYLGFSLRAREKDGREDEEAGYDGEDARPIPQRSHECPRK
jgi:hypothetical protein